MENIEYKNIIFIHNKEAMEFSKNPLGLYPDNDEFLRINCKFLKEKIDEGYKPLGYDPHAVGFYFEKPCPVLEFKITETFERAGTGFIYLVKADINTLKLGGCIILDGKEFLLSAFEYQAGNKFIGLIGRFLDETK